MVGLYTHFPGYCPCNSGHSDRQVSSTVLRGFGVNEDTVDTLVAFNIFRLSQLNVELLVKFAAILFFNPAFLGPGLLITALGGLLGQIYMRAQLPVKRVSSNARSPVIGQ